MNRDKPKKKKEQIKKQKKVKKFIERNKKIKENLSPFVVNAILIKIKTEREAGREAECYICGSLDSLGSKDNSIICFECGNTLKIPKIKFKENK